MTQKYMDNTREQSKYFDKEPNQFPSSQLLHPSLAQKLEMEQLLQHVCLTFGSTIMDFGSGSGRVSLFCLQRGFNVVSVDISSQSLLKLETMYKKNKKASWGKLKTTTTLPNFLVDGVVGADVLHHVSIGDILMKIYKCIKPGGRIAFSEPNAYHLPWYLHFLLNRIPWNIEKGILNCTYSNLLEEFKRASYAEAKIVGFGLLPQPIVPDWAQSFNSLVLGNLPLIKRLAFRFIVSAKIPN